MKKVLILSQSKGLSLIVLLTVIGTIAILAVIFLVTVNPTKQSQQAPDNQQILESSRDTSRESDVTAIVNAVHQYAVDNDGSLPSTITTIANEIGSGIGKVDLCYILTPTYISGMPYDPSTGSYTSCTIYSTGYAIVRDAKNRVTVSATPEIRDSISVSR